MSGRPSGVPIVGNEKNDSTVMDAVTTLFSNTYTRQFVEDDDADESMEIDEGSVEGGEEEDSEEVKQLTKLLSVCLDHKYLSVKTLALIMLKTYIQCVPLNVVRESQAFSSVSSAVAWKHEMHGHKIYCCFTNQEIESKDGLATRWQICVSPFVRDDEYEHRVFTPAQLFSTNSRFHWYNHDLFNRGRMQQCSFDQQTIILQVYDMIINNTDYVHANVFNEGLKDDNDLDVFIETCKLREDVKQAAGPRPQIQSVSTDEDRLLKMWVWLCAQKNQVKTKFKGTKPQTWLNTIGLYTQTSAFPFRDEQDELVSVNVLHMDINVSIPKNATYQEIQALIYEMFVKEKRVYMQVQQQENIESYQNMMDNHVEKRVGDERLDSLIRQKFYGPPSRQSEKAFKEDLEAYKKLTSDDDKKTFAQNKVKRFDKDITKLLNNRNYKPEEYEILVLDYDNHVPERKLAPNYKHEHRLNPISEENEDKFYFSLLERTIDVYEPELETDLVNSGKYNPTGSLSANRPLLKSAHPHQLPDNEWQSMIDELKKPGNFATWIYTEKYMSESAIAFWTAARRNQRPKEFVLYIYEDSQSYEIWPNYSLPRNSVFNAEILGIDAMYRVFKEYLSETGITRVIRFKTIDEIRTLLENYTPEDCIKLNEQLNAISLDMQIAAYNKDVLSHFDQAVNATCSSETWRLILLKLLNCPLFVEEYTHLFVKCNGVYYFVLNAFHLFQCLIKFDPQLPQNQQLQKILRKTEDGNNPEEDEREFTMMDHLKEHDYTHLNIDTAYEKSTVEEFDKTIADLMYSDRNPSLSDALKRLNKKYACFGEQKPSLPVAGKWFCIN